MRIESVELENIGAFTRKIVIGPFEPGLNVLAQRNEAGKTTLVRALAHAFFDRYNAAHEEIRALRPAGTSLCPQVEVTFAVNGDRFRLTKCFLDRKSSELLRWDAAGGRWGRIAESHGADEKARELLGAPPLDSAVKKVKPEHWGMLQFLWARQGERTAWPGWDGSAEGERVRSMLATVEIDPVVDELAGRLRRASAELFTETGKVKKNSALDVAQGRIDQLEEQLAKVRARRAELETTETRHAQIECELALLGPQRDASREAAELVRRHAEEAERQLAKIARLDAELKAARAALEAVRNDDDAIEAATRAIEQAAESMKTAQAKLDAAAARLPALEEAIEKSRAALAGTVRERDETQRKTERLLSLQRLGRSASELAARKATHARAAALAAERDHLTAERARLPALTRDKLGKWRELELEIAELRARLEAMSLRVTLRAGRDGTATVEEDGGGGRRTIHLSAEAPEVVKAPQHLTLMLSGWGEVRITSGAAGTAEIEASLREREARLAAALHEAGVTRLAEAEAALAAASQLDQQMEKLDAESRALPGAHGTAAELAAEISRLERKLAAAQEGLAPTAEETAQTTAAIEAEEERLAVSAKQLAASEKRLRAEMEEQCARRDRTRETRVQAERELATLQAASTVHASQRAEILKRHGDGGLAAALRAAQSEFVQAEARCDEARAALPPEAVKLPERSRQAARAAAEVAADFQTRSDTCRHLAGQLESLGREGLYSQETALEEQLAAAGAEADRLRRRGWAQRLVCELIERRRRAATQRVLAPLEARMSALFAELTGERNRRVFLTERLEIAGIGSRPDALHAFDFLSQGAKEQLLLALRAAIALQLCKDACPPLLILDDVLVNTDAVRQRAVLDLLGSLAAQMQILVLTCHADRYRGAGALLDFATVPAKTAATAAAE